MFCRDIQKVAQAHLDKLSQPVRVLDFGAGISSQQSEPGKWENALVRKMGELPQLLRLWLEEDD